jgi:hypothetical protein
MNQGDMKNLVRVVCAAVAVIALNACATNDQGQAVIDTNQVNIVIGKLLTPLPANSDDSSDNSGDSADNNSRSAPDDKYVAAASDQDVEVSGGNTYIWAADANGQRHRVLYGNGDQRAQLLARRTQLQKEAARNGGALSAHAGAARNGGTATQSMAQNGKQSNASAARTHGGAAPVVANAAVPAKAGPLTSAPAKPAKPAAAKQAEKKTTS